MDHTRSQTFLSLFFSGKSNVRTSKHSIERNIYNNTAEKKREKNRELENHMIEILILKLTYRRANISVFDEIRQSY